MSTKGDSPGTNVQPTGYVALVGDVILRPSPLSGRMAVIYQNPALEFLELQRPPVCDLQGNHPSDYDYVASLGRKTGHLGDFLFLRVNHHEGFGYDSRTCSTSTPLLRGDGRISRNFLSMTPSILGSSVDRSV